jgi:hypothetical protein
LIQEKPVINPSATSSGRRTALANWIASGKNPLTARVYVNRVWAQYFGHGIGETVGDFGRAGQNHSLKNNWVNTTRIGSAGMYR